MDQILPPPLGAAIYGTIEVEQYEIHKRHLALLREMQVLEGGGPWEVLPPRNPGRLREILSAYAEALFHAEAKQYPQSPHTDSWLRALGQKIEAMLERRVLEQELISVPKLTYHTSKDQLSAMIREAVQSELERRVGPTQVGPTSVSPSLVTPARIPPASARMPAPRSPVGTQIRTLRRESRLTIAELAEQVGIAARTVQRHESGEVHDIRLRHVRVYERLFSETLQRPVRLGIALSASS
jgi:DNA-binding XRE family transcriptional regulator